MAVCFLSVPVRPSLSLTHSLSISLSALSLSLRPPDRRRRTHVIRPRFSSESFRPNRGFVPCTRVYRRFPRVFTSNHRCTVVRATIVIIIIIIFVVSDFDRSEEASVFIWPIGVTSIFHFLSVNVYCFFKHKVLTVLRVCVFQRRALSNLYSFENTVW